MASSLFFLLQFTACALLYLSHRHQGWLAQPLDMRWRICGGALLPLSLACALHAWSPLAASAIWAVTQMLAFSLLPFAPLLRTAPAASPAAAPVAGARAAATLERAP